jgi:hypothetical protein
MAWFRISSALTVPLVVAAMVGLPFWLNDAPMAGKMNGVGPIATVAIAVVLREQSDIQRTLVACVAKGHPCVVRPGAFHRFCRVWVHRSSCSR